MLDLWYKNAILYCIDVETYMDANGDGVGDFEGLTQRLDYIAGLGITCIWLLPFYPTPNKDNGNKTKLDVESPYLYLKEMRNFLSWRRGDAILLAEANVSVPELPKYFGDGDKMQMLFNFIVNQHLFLALAQEKATPLIEGLKALPNIPEIGQWGNFIRNHDELTLDKLSDAQHEEIAAAFAPDKEKMWIFDRGIRRRFAPMVDGDLRRLQLAYSLMLTLPGTPVINYGEELGMGDDLSLEERNPARTPMQWSSEPNGGFSTAPPDQLVLPVIAEGKYSYKHLNVINQRRDPKSLLNWMERAIRMRKECPFGWGICQIIDTENPCVFAHRCEWLGGVVIAVHNLDREACNVTLKLEEGDGESLIDLLQDHPYEPIEGTAHDIQLDGYGYRWFRVGSHHL